MTVVLGFLNFFAQDSVKRSEVLLKSSESATKQQSLFSWSKLPVELMGCHLQKLKGSSAKILEFEAILTKVQYELLPGFVRQLGRLEEVYQRRLDVAMNIQNKMLAACMTVVLGFLNFFAQDSVKDTMTSALSSAHGVTNGLLRSHLRLSQGSEQGSAQPLTGIG